MERFVQKWLMGFPEGVAGLPRKSKTKDVRQQGGFPITPAELLGFGCGRVSGEARLEEVA